jgi:Xaa-Pro aminopeptidase
MTGLSDAMAPTAEAARAGVPGPAGNSDRDIKRRRVLDILAARELDGVLLTSSATVGWYLDGGRTHVGLAADPIVNVLVTREGDHAVTFTNEADRLRTEELPSGLQLHTVPWYGSLSDVPSWLGQSVQPVPEAELGRELRDARRALLPGESTRYAALCRTAAEALTDELSIATPASTERAVAAGLAARIVAAGADPLVLLCSGSSRAGFRHPLPTDAPLGRRAMVVVCARRNGMIANVTRWVRFDSSTAAERDAEARIAAVEADVFAATRPGARLNSILTTFQASYAAHGFGSDQWQLHHQGGPAGYAGRDPRATPQTDDEVVLSQAFTWNPSAPGVKIEDTVQLTDQGIRPLSVDPRWPVVDVAGLSRPVPLEL